MGIFDNLVKTKHEQQHNIKLHDYDEKRRIHHVTKEDIVQHQLLEEQVRYEHLQAHAMDEGVVGYETLGKAHDFDEAPTLAEQKRKLAPPIDEAGMGKKRRQKVRNRTLQNLKEGRELVGEMGTAQTIPLMRSIKKNAKKIAEEKKKDRSSIIELSNLQIPTDIFDVNLTKEHSHFDVKKALIIRDKLDKIRQYKEENTVEYAMLDFKLYTRLEYMLEVREAFTRTLKVVLAANGLSETGEPITDQKKIAQGRDDYYSHKEALRELVDGKDAYIAQMERDQKAERERAFTASGTFFAEKDAARNAAMAALRSKNIEIPDGFKSSVYYSRCVYRLKKDDPELNEKMLRMAIDAYKLNRPELTGDDRDEIFKRVREQMLPEYKERLKKLPVLVDKIMSSNLEELLKMQDEILEFEMPGMHISDIMNSMDSGNKSLLSLIGLTDADDAMIKKYNSIISLARKRIDMVNAYRAAGAGVTMNLSQCCKNVENICRPHADENNVLDNAGVMATLEEKIRQNTDTIKGLTGALTEVKRGIYEERKAEIEHSKGLEKVFNEERPLNMQTVMDYVTTHMEEGDLKKYQDSFNTRTRVSKDLRPLFEAFRSSGMKTKTGVASGDPDEKIWEDFRSMTRELINTGHSYDYSEGPIMIGVSEDDATIDELIELHTHPTEANILRFMEPILTFKPETLFGRFDEATLNDIARREETVARLKAECHPLLARKQWAEKFLLDGALSEETTKKVEAAMKIYDKAMYLVDNMALPTLTSATEFRESDVAGYGNVAECIRKGKELEAAAGQAEAEFLQDHPLVHFTKEEAQRLGLSSSNDLKGLTGAHIQSADDILLPVTKEEAEKAASSDRDFVNEQAEKIRSFSFVSRFGRARVLPNSDAGDLALFGAEDLKYYEEIEREARLLLIANECSKEKTEAALGKNAGKIIQDCRRIVAVTEGLREKLKIDFRVPSEMETEHRNLCGESLNDAMLMREEQLHQHNEKAMKKIRGGSL